MVSWPRRLRAPYSWRRAVSWQELVCLIGCCLTGTSALFRLLVSRIVEMKRMRYVDKDLKQTIYMTRDSEWHSKVFIASDVRFTCYTRAALRHKVQKFNYLIFLVNVHNKWSSFSDDQLWKSNYVTVVLLVKAFCDLLSNAGFSCTH